MGIDATLGTEHTELVEQAEFPGTIASLSSDSDEEAKKARRYTGCTDEQSFSMDRSRLDTERTRASVAWWQTE